MMHILRMANFEQFEERVQTIAWRAVSEFQRQNYISSLFSALLYDTSIRKIKPGITNFRLFKEMLAFP